MNSSLTNQLLTLSIIVLLISCGKKKEAHEMANTSKQELNQDIHGRYVAKILPLNQSIAGEVKGNLSIVVSGDDFIVQSKVFGSHPGIKHLQSIHVGTKCPDSSTDTNGDGVIDAQEGMATYGKVLIPLDSDLSDQEDGSDFGPIANQLGNFYYKESASLIRLLSDLHQQDLDVRDEFQKLAGKENLKLQGAVVVIYGINNGIELPSTVASIGDLSPYEALPVACGEIKRALE